MATVLNTILGRTAKKGKKKATRAAAKKSVKKRAAAQRPAQRQGSASNSAASNSAADLDVRSKADVGKLEDLLKKNKIVLILVYADWCGHCKTFKQDVWSKLASLPNRKLPLAQVNEAVMAQTPVANAKIDGYPSVLLMGQDGKAAEFKDEATGEATNAMPNTRDLEQMKTLVTKNAEIVTPTNTYDEPVSATPTKEAEDVLNAAGDNAANEILNGNLPKLTRSTATIQNPPSVEDDLLASQMSTGTAKANTGLPLNSAGLVAASSGANASAMTGGSLYAALLEAAGKLAAPALLAGTAVALDRRSTSRKAARRAARRRATAKKLAKAAAAGQV